MLKDRDFETLDEAFPHVDSGIKPFGARVVFQHKLIKKATKGGIVLPDEARQTEKVQTMVAKVVAIGDLAFKKRDSGEPWPEGSWYKVGDYVRIPRWSGDRIAVPHPTDKNEEVLFQVMNDHEPWSLVDPDRVLSMKSFI
jgi:co-chaperonin GroES (HSP10)